MGFVFTNEDLVDVRDKLLANKKKAPARAGAIAPCPVTIPNQNTGLGPEKTSFFQALQIPTKISRGTIEIVVSRLITLVFSNVKVDLAVYCRLRASVIMDRLSFLLSTYCFLQTFVF